MARLGYVVTACLTAGLGFAVASSTSVAASRSSTVANLSGTAAVWDVATTAASGTTVTPKDNGHTVTLKPGGRLTISLKDNNPSTGYSWSYKTKPSRKVLALVSDRTASAPSGVTGAPQPRTITYRAVAKGSTRLRLVLHAPGSGTKPTATLALTVDVN